MNIDLTKLSDKEIVELRKALLEESNNRGYRLKSNARIYGNLIEAGFVEQIKSEGLTDNYDATHVVGSLEKAIFKLCDVSLGNYEIKERRSRNSTNDKWKISKHLICGGATLYDECYTDFLDMAEEITNICVRYFNKSMAYRKVKYVGYEDNKGDK